MLDEIQLSNNNTIKSIELVEIINEFRKEESEATNKKYTELQHKIFMRSIRKELDVLKSMGLDGGYNFVPSYYINTQNKKQPCYELNRDGMLQMLNSESAIVRDKTIQYINKLEKKIEQISEKDRLLLDLFSNDPMVVSNAHKQLVELEKKPLLDTIEEQKPKVEYHDNVLNPTDLKKLVTTTAIAKDMGTTAKKLNEVLHNLGIQYKQSNSWYVTTKYAYLIKDGYADYVINQFGQILKWSEEGRKFIIDTLKSNNYLDANGTFK